jgi:succinate dehydrogenase / fumarate reductase cytochrome b subunit
MISLRQALFSTVGRKLITAVTGLGFVFFVVVHLLENLLLFKNDATTFNEYVAFLHRFGGAITIAEICLAALILFHALNSLWIQKTNWFARTKGYRAGIRTKGGESRLNVSSRTMWITGSLILGFLVLHIMQFRFGPGIQQGYVTSLNGEDALDLHRLVLETFRNPYFATIYMVAMLFVGFHVRHGFWSAFQSLGAMSSRWTKPMYFAGLVLGILLAVGFLMIPVWIYFDLPSRLFG